MSKTKVFIVDTFNPLLSFLKKTLEKDFQCVSALKSSEVVITFAYHNEEDILEMTTMEKIIYNEKYDDKKIIFLSWFHPLENLDYYSQTLFSPENRSCILMDASRYRILQLPIGDSELIETVKSISKENS